METTPPQEPRPAPLGDFREAPGQQQEGAPANKGPTSLVLAILAPLSMFLTGPFAGLAMLLTHGDNGYSRTPWVAPLVLFSLPLLFGTLALRLALPALKGSPRNSGNWSAAAVSLCICGLVFVLALGPALSLTGLF
jgi:hypothetical protein